MACDAARPIQFDFFSFWQNSIFRQFRLVSLPFSRLQTNWTMAPDLQKCFPLPLFSFELFHFDYLLLFLDDHTVMFDRPTEAILNWKHTSHSDKQKKKRRKEDDEVVMIEWMREGRNWMLSAIKWIPTNHFIVCLFCFVFYYLSESNVIYRHKKHCVEYAREKENGKTNKRYANFLLKLIHQREKRMWDLFQRPRAQRPFSVDRVKSIIIITTLSINTNMKSFRLTRRSLTQAHTYPVHARQKHWMRDTRTL